MTIILSHETTIFGLKMMVKNGIESFILKSYVPLQKYLLTCQAHSAILGRNFLHWAAATMKEHVGNCTYFLLALSVVNFGKKYEKR